MIKMLLKEKNIKIEVKRVFFVFSQWFFYYYWVSSGKFSIWLNKVKKDKHVYNFMRYMWGFLTSKNALLMRRWKCHHVLFHMEQHMSTLVVWFVVGESFFFFFFSLFSLENYSLTLFVIDISISVLILLIYIFCFWPFCKSFICFQFHPSISIYQKLYFPIWFLFFWFLFFSLSPFIKVLVVFNFILQFKLMVLCFPI